LLVASLANRSILKPCGLVPLEQVDGRYERVATCQVCGASSGEHKIVLWKYNTPVVRCKSCGLYYANPRWKTEHLFSRYTEDYWEEYAGTISHTSVDEATNNAHWSPFLWPHDGVRLTNRLLDVGCATGEFLLAARARHWQVYGVESSPIGAATAARVPGSQVHSGTLDTADYPDSYFDVVTMWDVIEHLQSPRRYLQRISEILRPGGLLSITTPNIRSLSFWLLGVNWSEVGPNDHLYYFTPRTLARLLDECGFSIYTMSTMAVEAVVWRQWLKYQRLHPLAPLLRNLSLPITNRLLLGDELYVIAQRRSDP
jgi:2-polyprenyl-3-methyl-5-hydroxy-6-metoxy-1,4-benzoquinol methylase